MGTGRSNRGLRRRSTKRARIAGQSSVLRVAIRAISAADGSPKWSGPACEIAARVTTRGGRPGGGGVRLIAEHAESAAITKTRVTERVGVTAALLLSKPCALGGGDL